MSVPAGISERALPHRQPSLRRRLLVEERDQRLAALAAAVDDRDLGRAGERKLDADRPRRTAGAEHHDPLAARIDHFRQRLQEPLAVGVLADEALAAADGAVDRAHDARRLAEPVEMLDHGDLVRDRAVEADPAHGAGPLHRVAELLRRHLAIDVAGVDAVMPIRGLDHGDGRILGGTLREGAGEHAQEFQCACHCRPRFTPIRHRIQGRSRQSGDPAILTVLRRRESQTRHRRSSTPSFSRPST